MRAQPQRRSPAVHRSFDVHIVTPAHGVGEQAGAAQDAAGRSVAQTLHQKGGVLGQRLREQESSDWLLTLRWVLLARYEL